MNTVSATQPQTGTTTASATNAAPVQHIRHHRDMSRNVAGLYDTGFGGHHDLHMSAACPIGHGIGLTLRGTVLRHHRHSDAEPRRYSAPASASGPPMRASRVPGTMRVSAIAIRRSGSSTKRPANLTRPSRT